MTTTPTQAARVRSLVDHPIIDADGHFVELGPAAAGRGHQLRRGRRRRCAARALPRHCTLVRHVVEPGRPGRSRGPAAVEGDAVVVGMADRATCGTAPRRTSRRCSTSGSTRSASTSRSSTRRWRSAYFEVTDEELSSVLCRAVNRYHAAPVRAVRGSLHRRRADPDEHARAGRRRGGVRGARSWARSRCSSRGTHAARSEPAGYRLDMFGVDSDHDYDPLWAKCVELGVAPVVHSALQQHRVTRSDLELRVQPRQRTRRGARVAVQVAVPRRRHPSVPGAAHRVPRGWRGVGVRAVLVDLVGHWEKRNRDAIVELDPDRLDVDALLAVLRPSTATTRSPARIDELRDVLRAPGGASRAGRRVRGSRHRDGSTTCATASSPTSTSAARPTTRWWRGRSATT